MIWKILTYKCPVCGAEFENESGNNYLVCKKCHNKVEMDNSYALSAVNGKLPFNVYGLHSFLCRILEILQGTIVKSLYPYPIFSLIICLN